ncbi:MAG: YbbR-like domain-containing protein [Ignavibacteriae bacterium]|nr:YbbR-like domain-containing protein [Ignavibacteriota bacterium]
MRKNILIYILSFVGAALLWLYVNLNLSYTINFQIPLEVKTAGSQALGSDLPSFIDLTVKGKGWELLGIILSKKKSFNLDLSSFKKDTKINVSQKLGEILEIPSGVSVLNVNPEILEINFDNITSRMVKVKNMINVVPKENYFIIGQPSVSPDSVKIIGAMSVIGKIKFLPTESVNINDVNSGFTRTFKIIDTLNNIMKIEPKTVTISYRIELSAEKNIEDVNVVVRDVPPDKEVLLVPPKLKIYLRGGVEQLAKINPEEILASVDFRSIDSDSLGYVSPKITLPVDASIIKYEPQKFQYIIKKKNTENK